MLPFEKFIEKYPEVYKEFKHLSLLLIKRGYKKYSAKGIVEVIRFKSAVRFKTFLDNPEPFKINNNYTPDLARKFINDLPEHKDFFSFRELKKKNR